MKFKRGVQGYASILAALQSPKTIQELAVLGGRKDSLRHFSICLRQMMQLELIHTCDWRTGEGKGPARRVLVAGKGIEPPYPVGINKNRMPRRQRAPGKPVRVCTNLLAFAEIIRGLEAGGTTDELSTVSGLSKGPIQKVLRLMRRKGIAHIHAWDRIAPIWKLGKRSDARRPRADTVAEIGKRYRARIKEARRFLPLDSILRIAA